MKLKHLLLLSLLSAGLLFVACKNSDKKKFTKEPKFKEENITYTSDGVTMNGFVVYDENKTGKSPAILVVHEWWGMNDYTKRRARELAGLGYVAMAIDEYGNGKVADNPDTANSLAMPLYMNPRMAKTRLEAAIARLKEYKQVDTEKIGAIGYCFGGGVLLNCVRLGEDLKAVVSFHGMLLGTAADKSLLKAKILVCHGADDQFVPPADVALFKKQMDSIGADYSFKMYAGATHAFTNPNATAMGEKFKLPIAYNAAADTASWKDMKEFFEKIFK